MDFDFVALSSDGVTQYPIRVVCDADKISISCGCRAGSFNQLCRHILAVVSGNGRDVGVAQECCDQLSLVFDKSAALNLYQNMHVAEVELAKAKKNLDFAKKLLLKEITLIG